VCVHICCFTTQPYRLYRSYVPKVYLIMRGGKVNQCKPINPNYNMMMMSSNMYRISAGNDLLFSQIYKRVRLRKEQIALNNEPQLSDSVSVMLSCLLALRKL